MCRNGGRLEYDLAREADWCDVDHLQMGGRLGGKGASSRNEQEGYRHRIEEHGLHLWLGYYENAFRIIRSCFYELRDPRKAKREGSHSAEVREHLDREPFDNWNWLSAFERASLVGLADDSSGDWVPWVARFPEYVLAPKGAPPPKARKTPPKTRKTFLATTSRTARCCQVWTSWTTARVCTRASNPGAPNAQKTTQATTAKRMSRTAECRVLHHARASRAPGVHGLVGVAHRTDRLQQAARFPGSRRTPAPGNRSAAAARCEPIEPPPDVSRLLLRIRLLFLVPAIETLSTVSEPLEGPVPTWAAPWWRCSTISSIDARGIERFVQRDTAARTVGARRPADGQHPGHRRRRLEGADDFSSLDKWNYIDWLRMNRIAEQTLNNPLIRGAHDLGFSYRDGNTGNPQIAAGQAISAGCRFFFMYKGACSGG